MTKLPWFHNHPTASYVSPKLNVFNLDQEGGNATAPNTSSSTSYKEEWQKRKHPCNHLIGLLWRKVL